jgi:hypothetical protein
MKLEIEIDMNQEQNVLKRSNGEFLSYLDSAIYLFLHNKEAQETLGKLRKKLKGDDLNKLDMILFLNGIESFAKLSIDKVRNSTDGNYSPKFFELQKIKKEAQESLNSYISSIDNLEFLVWIANVTYWIAKIEGARMIKLHENFVKDWIRSHVKTTRETVSLRKGEQAKALLRNIVGEDIDNVDKMIEEEERSKRRIGKWISINLDEELDVSKLTVGEYHILTMQNVDSGLPNIVTERDECIYINDKGYNIREYYEERAARFKKELLKSQDLLDQILVIYIIKRAQNGDEVAFDFLFRCYEDSAARLARKFLRVKAANYKINEFEPSGLLSVDEGISEVRRLLMLNLKGENPSNAIKYLDASPEDKKNTDRLNKKPYEAFLESYEIMFELINKQTLLLRSGLEKLKKRGKDLKHRSYKTRSFNYKVEHLEVLFSISQSYLLQAQKSVTTFSIINPADMLRISPKFNKSLYRPNKKSNLTIWLFGLKNSPKQQGVLWWGLDAWFKSHTLVKNGKRLVPQEDYSHIEPDENEYSENSSDED